MGSTAHLECLPNVAVIRVGPNPEAVASRVGAGLRVDPTQYDFAQTYARARAGAYDRVVFDKAIQRAADASPKVNRLFVDFMEHRRRASGPHFMRRLDATGLLRAHRMRMRMRGVWLSNSTSCDGHCTVGHTCIFFGPDDNLLLRLVGNGPDLEGPP